MVLKNREWGWLFLNVGPSLLNCGWRVWMGLSPRPPGGHFLVILAGVWHLFNFQVVIHFTDGVDGDLADLQRASEDLRQEGGSWAFQTGEVGLGEAGTPRCWSPLGDPGDSSPQPGPLSPPWGYRGSPRATVGFLTKSWPRTLRLSDSFGW